MKFLGNLFLVFTLNAVQPLIVYAGPVLGNDYPAGIFPGMHSAAVAERIIKASYVAMGISYPSDKIADLENGVSRLSAAGFLLALAACDKISESGPVFRLMPPSVQRSISRLHQVLQTAAWDRLRGLLDDLETYDHLSTYERFVIASASEEVLLSDLFTSDKVFGLNAEVINLGRIYGVKPIWEGMNEKIKRAHFTDQALVKLTTETIDAPILNLMARVRILDQVARSYTSLNRNADDVKRIEAVRNQYALLVDALMTRYLTDRPGEAKTFIESNLKPYLFSVCDAF